MNRSPHIFLQRHAVLAGGPEPAEGPGPRYQKHTKLVQRTTGRRFDQWYGQRNGLRNLPWENAHLDTASAAVIGPDHVEDHNSGND